MPALTAPGLDAVSSPQIHAALPRYLEVRGNIAMLKVRWPFAGAMVLVAALMAILAPLLWRPETINYLMREHGPIENATGVWYVAAVVSMWLVDRGVLEKRSAAAASVILIVCVAKEISLRRQLLAAAGFSPEPFIFTAWPNLLAALLALALFAAVAWLIWRYGRAVLAGAARREPFLFTLAMAFGCLVASQAMDYFLKLDRPLGWSMSLRPRAVMLSLEEVLEMMVPILIVVVALQLGVRRPGRYAARAMTSVT